MNPARLACLNHAASVHSEPGSNSPKENFQSVLDPGLNFRTLNVCTDDRNHRRRPRNNITIYIGHINKGLIGSMTYQSHLVTFKERRAF
jgi:hypothetical protein